MNSNGAKTKNMVVDEREAVKLKKKAKAAFAGFQERTICIDIPILPLLVIGAKHAAVCIRGQRRRAIAVARTSSRVLAPCRWQHRTGGVMMSSMVYKCILY